MIWWLLVAWVGTALMLFAALLLMKMMRDELNEWKKEAQFWWNAAQEWQSRFYADAEDAHEGGD